MILILENAINFNNIEEAKLMIKKGNELTEKTGVKTMSKFQLFNESNIVNPEHKDYCMERMLSFGQAHELFNYGLEIGQEVFFTCCFPKAVDWCEEIGVSFYKVRFYDRKNKPLINKILKTNKPFFYSTENTLIPYFPNVIILWCSPNYPADKNDYYTANLYNFKGLSDHSSDLDLLKESITSNYNNLEYFEKHVCLTKEGCLEAEWASTFEELEEVLK